MPETQTPETAGPLRPADRCGWWRTAAVLTVALLVYIGTTRLVGRDHSPNTAYFDHLAAAFLDGELHLADPPGTYDLTRHDDRWYVPFPPLAALLLLPWVALFGVAGMNTVLFSAIFGAVNVAIVARILDALARRGWIELQPGDRTWLVLLFAVGCVHWQIVTEGSVWFLSQTCTVTFIALAVWAAVATRSASLAGTALAIALWGRPNVIFTWPLLLGIAAQHLRAACGQCDRGRLACWAWKSALPLAVSVAGLAAYNQARFGSPFEFGYRKQEVSAAVVRDLARGQFHPYYIPRNLHVLLFGPPRWYEPETLPVPAGWSLPIPDDRGMSILLTTPALLYLVRARRKREPFIRSAWLATGLLLIPLLLYYNTGWRQFGYRFSLDFMIPLMVLLAVAVGHRMSWPMRACILAGVAVNAWGVIWWFTNWLD